VARAMAAVRHPDPTGVPALRPTRRGTTSRPASYAEPVADDTRDGLSAISIRRATAADVRATYDVFLDAADHLAQTRGWAPTVRPPDPPERFLAFRASALLHDPAGFWVAEAHGGLVAFGIAVQREHVWYLAALHVRPLYQSRGLGAAIIRKALEAVVPGSLLTVGADARNPVSNALYGRFGMFPETPLLPLSGPSGIGDSQILRPGLPAHDDLAAIDRAILDVARPADHAFWRSVSSLHGFTVVMDDRVAGYAYVQTDGAIGPIAVLDPDILAPALDAAIAVAADLGASTAHVRIPGVARNAIEALLARGWHYGDAVTLVLTSAPWGHWDRYVTSGGDALI
jgi:GNAT superfamily N-acetyltransferase